MVTVHCDCPSCGADNVADQTLGSRLQVVYAYECYVCHHWWAIVQSVLTVDTGFRDRFGYHVAYEQVDHEWFR